MFEALDIGASGLKAQRVRLDTLADNIANMDVTHGPNGEKTPFRRRLVTFQEGQAAGDSRPGVHVASVFQDEKTPFRRVHDEGNPDADKDGYVLYPNIDPTKEMVNAIDASRAYEANVTMMETAKSMLNSSLRLLA